MYGRVVLRFSTCFPNLLTVLFFHNKSILMLNQNCDFGAVFSLLQGQVLLRYGNLFRVPQKITCSEQGFRKIRFANGLELAEKTNRFHLQISLRPFEIQPFTNVTLTAK